jgi:hypothetical protein
MSEETRRVLDLLSQGKTTVDEADQLLKAVAAADAAPAESAPDAQANAGGAPKWIRISVHKPANDRRGDKDVNIRVPVAIVKGGMRLGALIAPFAGEKVASRMRERGYDLDLSKLDDAAIDAMLKDLGEMNIDVDNGKAQVRITCERA